MTVTRMATPRGPIPVTVDTFEASAWTGGGGYHGGGGGARGGQTHIRVTKRILGVQTIAQMSSSGVNS